MPPKKPRQFALLASAFTADRVASLEVRTTGDSIGARVRAGGLRIVTPTGVDGLRPYRHLN